MEETRPSLAKRAIAILVLVVAAFLLLKVIINVVAAVAWIAVIVIAIVGILWAISTLS
jgi:uncharacterized membrane protein YccC